LLIAGRRDPVESAENSLKKMNKSLKVFLFLSFFVLGLTIAQGVFAYKLEVPIGSTTEVESLPAYIALIARFAIGIISLLCVLMIVFGGFNWITAAGNEQRITDAKGTIIAAIVGLIIALGSYTLLNTISPNLVAFELTVDEVEGPEFFEAEANYSGGYTGDGSWDGDCNNKPSTACMNCSGLTVTPINTDYTQAVCNTTCLQLVSEAAQSWNAIAKAYYDRFHEKVPVCHMFRSPDYQRYLRDCGVGQSPARPCVSNHNFGTAIDVNTSSIVSNSNGTKQAKYNFLVCGQASETPCGSTKATRGFMNFTSLGYDSDFNVDNAQEDWERHHFDWDYAAKDFSLVCPGQTCQ